MCISYDIDCFAVKYSYFNCLFVFHRCGGDDHFARDCKEGKVDDSDKRCHLCRNVGHIARNCPEA